MELVAKDTEIRKLPERFINCYLPVSFKLTKYFRNTVDTYRILKTCTDFLFFNWVISFKLSKLLLLFLREDKARRVR